MVAISEVTTRPVESVVVRGATSGALAGIVMAMIAMVWSSAIDIGFWMPLRMIASVPLGTMPAEIALGTAIPVGLATHMAVSMMFGVALAAFVQLARGADGSAVATLALAAAFGAMVWLVNFYAVAPAMGRDWFTDADKPLQFVSHAFGFGLTAGLLLVIARKTIGRPR